MHILTPRGIHTSIQLLEWRLKNIPITAWARWLTATVEKCPPIVQLFGVWTTTVSRKAANNIQGILFDFICQFVLLSCKWKDVSASRPIAYSKIAVCAWLSFSSLSEKKHSVPSQLLPQMSRGRNVCTPLVDSWWGKCGEFFERDLPKAQCGLWSRAKTDAHWVLINLRISWGK